MAARGAAAIAVALRLAMVCEGVSLARGELE